MILWFPYTQADDDKFTRLLNDEGWVTEIKIPPSDGFPSRLLRSRYGMRIVACDLECNKDNDGYQSITITIERRLTESSSIFLDDD